jgi:hypothetical protein
MRMSTESALHMYRTEILPSVQDQPGYRGVLVLSTPEGRGAVLTFWDSADHAEASAPTGFYTQLLEQLMTIFKSPPGRERYEVAFADLPAVAPS